MFKPIDGLPPDVLALEMVGRTTHKDFEDVMIPKAEALMKAGPIKALMVVRSDLMDYVPEALWDAQLAAFKLRHWRDVERYAVVTDHAWLQGVGHMFAPFFPGLIRFFPLAELDTAKAWVVAG
jgi:hypothetical protein